MSFIVVDVEADGNVPGIDMYSMVCFGAIVVEPSLSKTFYGQVKPISDKFIPEALAISGFSREQHLTFDDPAEVMLNFKNWITENSKGAPIFITDNLAFDWQFINYYFHKYTSSNPFGYSGKRINDIYAGMERDMFVGSKWKRFRKTKHTHNPVDDAKGNAEALFEFKRLGLKIKLD